MCGICGFCGELSKYIGKLGMQEMLNIMKHRGPDDQGIYFHENAAIGMRRLSIIDRAGGHQPMHNENKTIWTVFNGEIYNFKELKQKLILKGHVFYSNSDTEVIVHMYEEYGKNFAKYFTGMFSIAIWDKINKKMILVRDRMGVKPLYYCIVNKTLVFASEIKSILKCGLVDASLNESALGVYLLYRYLPGKQTLFKNIYKLLPGYILEFSNNRPVIGQYWDLKPDESFCIRPECYYSQNVFNLLEDSIEDRIASDSKTGIFLSGGLDSTIILSEISKINGGKIKTFSAAFEKPQNDVAKLEYNELDYARKVSQYYSTEHYEYFIKPEEIIQDISEMIWYMDEPLSDPTAIPLYYVSKLASQYVRVVISGEGADEIFGGYSIYNEPNVIRTYNKLPGFIKNKIIEPVIKRMPFKKGKDFIRRSKYPVSYRYKGVGSTFRLNEIQELLHIEMFKDIMNSSIKSYVEDIFNNCSLLDEVNQMLYFDQKIWLPEDVLMKCDRMTMANSIELRVPFLDHRLVEFSMNIPSSLKYKKNCEKYILKKAFQNSIPDFVLKRKKNGFPTPISALINGEFKKFLMDTLLSQRAVNRGYFKPEYIEKLIKNSDNGEKYAGRQLWLLLTFELWQKMFMDSDVKELCSKIS